MAMARVYVSSTLLDLKAERQAVIEWLIAADHQPVHSYVADTETVRESCLRDVEGSDIYLLILGYRYGHEPEHDNPDNLSITHLEYRMARSKGIPTIALFRTSIPDTALSDLHDPDRLARIKAFRTEVADDVRASEFSDEAGLIGELSAAMPRALGRVRRSVLSPAALRDLFRHASSDLLAWRTSLPNDQWLRRPELDTLLQRIEADPQSVTLLLGEPGCGKSALLARLGQQLEAAGIPALGIKLDFLADTVQDQDDLREYLRLPAMTVDCVRTLAREGKVVVLVDQLDALADLVVQHSSRLRVPLELIRDLAGLENVHVVASSRVFEHSHDPRLRNLDVELLMLALPAWDDVDAALQAYGVRTAAWNEAMREDLRSPHALDIFVRLLSSTSEADLLQGYQHMLEALWKQAVLCDASGNRRRLVLELTERMAEREVLWLPMAAFEDQYAVILELEAAGVLIEDTGRIGFRHQTLYEFVRAKTFLEESGRLTETVLSRQESLRVRPQVWHALGYMRAVDRQAYLEEIRRLWGAALRPHLRMLVIEFLGQLQDPDPAEAALFFEKFEDPWFQGRVLAAVVGSRGWFTALARGHLPMLMVQPVEEAWRAVPILVDALEFDLPTVLALLDKHWLPHADKDTLAWEILSRATVWSPDMVGRCCRILARTDVAAWMVNHLASAVSMQLPGQGPRLAAAWLKREWGKDLPPDLRVDAESEEDEIWPQALWRESPQVKRCRELLEGHDLHDLPALAEGAPDAFLDSIWPWFLDVMDAVTEEAHPFVVGYRDAYSLIADIDDEDEARIEHPFWIALIRAVEKLAEGQAEDFLAFMRENEQVDFLVVQRLLAKGMVHIVGSYPDVALEFLCSDPRRLVLGSHSDNHRNTKDLIRSLAPHLDEGQFLRLEQALLNWNRYSRFPDDDAKTRLDRIGWNREHRLRLLKALPRERMSYICRRKVEEEERAFPDLKDWDTCCSEMSWIGSPVSAEQMAAGGDEDVLNLFSELTDEHDWDHPRQSMQGGAIQAGRELAKLAESDPERAVRLVRQMLPGRNEIPVGDVLEALATTAYDRNALYHLILELTAMGFASDHFRWSVARAVEKVVSGDHPLPDPLFVLLESWLVPADKPGAKESESRDEYGERNDSLLWGASRFTTLPHGNFPVLAALALACLRTEPAQTDRWLDILEAHLHRLESPRVWIAMSRYLQWLHLADRGRAQAFLSQLFLAYPSVLDTVEGVHLQAHCQRWIEPETTHRWLDQMLQGGGEVAVQGAGEVLMLRRSLFPDELVIMERLADVIHGAETDDKLAVARIGIAHAVAHLWREPQHRSLVHPYLLELLQDQNDGVLGALTHIFHAGELFPDQANRELLDALCAHPGILRHERGESVGECLETIVHAEPDRVCTVCNILIDLVGTDVGNIASSRYLMSESLLSISLTLQDLGASHRAQGTALFERMLEINIPQAREMLLELDKRTPQRASAKSVRRRRWKKGTPR